MIIMHMPLIVEICYLAKWVNQGVNKHQNLYSLMKIKSGKNGKIEEYIFK